MRLREGIYHQRGEVIMPPELLGYQYEEEKNKGGATALAGLPLYLDLAHVMGLSASVQRHVKVREGSQEYTDSQKEEEVAALDVDATLWRPASRRR
ncbi:MAG: hypothetical protein FJ128_11865 [Deltaproteobacteria bacterium]|nr:hypothetical protein [Deltaproteobacteria bacterium]